MDNKKDLTVKEWKVYLIAILAALIIGYFALLLYGNMWGREKVTFIFTTTKDNVLLYFIYIFLYFFIFIILAVLHELLHAAAFILFGKSTWKDIRFGIMWSSITPYVHCSKPLNAWAYRISLVFPTIVLGVVPSLIGFGFEYGFLAFWGTIMLIGGVGDMIILFLIKKLPGNTLLMDHPSKIGCEIISVE